MVDNVSNSEECLQGSASQSLALLIWKPHLGFLTCTRLAHHWKPQACLWFMASKEAHTNPVCPGWIMQSLTRSEAICHLSDSHCSAHLLHPFYGDLEGYNHSGQGGYSHSVPGKMTNWEETSQSFGGLSFPHYVRKNYVSSQPPWSYVSHCVDSLFVVICITSCFYKPPCVGLAHPWLSPGHPIILEWTLLLPLHLTLLFPVCESMWVHTHPSFLGGRRWFHVPGE